MVTLLPGKSEYTGPKSFRPTSLTSFLLNGFEKLIRQISQGWPNGSFANAPQTACLCDRNGIRPVKTGCWFVGGDDLTGALHDLQLQ